MLKLLNIKYDLKIHVVVWHATKNCATKRAARAARLFFLIQPIKSLICGVVVAVTFVIWNLKQGRRQRETTTPENNDLIGWIRKNNRASRAARTLKGFLDVVCQMTT